MESCSSSHTSRTRSTEITFCINIIPHLNGSVLPGQTPKCSSSLSQFIHRAMGHHHCGFCIRTGSGIAIGNGDPAKWLATDSCRISRTAVRVTVGPSIDGNTRNIPVEVEQLPGKHTTQVTSDLLFIILELQPQHPVSRFTKLLTSWFAKFPIWTADHLNDTWVVGGPGIFIAAHAHRKVHQHGLVHISR